MIQQNEYDADDLYIIGLVGCDYDECTEEGCRRCELYNCLLFEHLGEKDIYRHIYIKEYDIEYPAILVLTDAYCEEGTLVSISEAKSNTKFGYRRD